MGAGASTSDAAEKAAAATVEEIEAQLAALPAETRDKLKVAVANLEKASQTPQTAIRAGEEAKDISTPRGRDNTRPTCRTAAATIQTCRGCWQQLLVWSQGKRTCRRGREEFDGALIESELCG